MCLFGVYTGLIFFQSCKIRANLDFAVYSLWCSGSIWYWRCELLNCIAIKQFSSLFRL